MHLSERLGLNSGRLATAPESEIVSAFERWFIAADFLFLTHGPTITLLSDFGTTFIVVRSSDATAKIYFAMVPSAALPAAQIKAVVAAACAENESEQRLVIIEKVGLPLMLVSEISLLRPYTRASVSAAFLEFARNTETPIADSVRRTSDCG